MVVLLPGRQDALHQAAVLKELQESKEELAWGQLPFRARAGKGLSTASQPHQAPACKQAEEGRVGASVWPALKPRFDTGSQVAQASLKLFT